MIGWKTPPWSQAHAHSSTAPECLDKILAASGSSLPSKGYRSFGVHQETASKTNGKLRIREREELFLWGVPSFDMTQGKRNEYYPLVFKRNLRDWRRWERFLVMLCWWLLNSKLGPKCLLRVFVPVPHSFPHFIGAGFASLTHWKAAEVNVRQFWDWHVGGTFRFCFLCPWNSWTIVWKA